MKVKNKKNAIGTVTVPGDKSIAHRALILGSIAEGNTEIINLPDAEDVKSTIRCIEALGIEFTNGRVHGKGLFGYTKPKEALDAGNSGTTMRLLSGILAASRFDSVITGDLSLMKRPMKRIIEPLLLMGARIKSSGGLAPLIIHGNKLRGIRYELPVASAQLKSCLLFAGLFAEGLTEIIESQATRNHSEIMLREFGANIHETTIKPGKLYAAKISIPCDISSAAYFMALAALLPNSEICLPNIGMNPGRKGIIDVLLSMGVDVKVSGKKVVSGELAADITVLSSSLKAVDISEAIIPSIIDELPLVALLACFADGQTVISGASELRHKESDRITATICELKKMGADITETEDGMIINGTGKLYPAVVSSHGDHRIAMTLAVAACLASGESEIEYADCVNISYPNFFNELDQL